MVSFQPLVGSVWPTCVSLLVSQWCSGSREAAILAALPQSPTVYSPYGSHKDKLFIRQHYILDLMAEQGYITQADADAAKKEEVKFAPDSENITAPHFVMYVKDLLIQKLNLSQLMI